jgi:hypothetical protein
MSSAGGEGLKPGLRIGPDSISIWTARRGGNSKTGSRWRRAGERQTGRLRDASPSPRSLKNGTPARSGAWRRQLAGNNSEQVWMQKVSLLPCCWVLE